VDDRIWLYWEEGLNIERRLVPAESCLTEAATTVRPHVRRMQLGSWHWRQPEAGMAARRPAPGARLAMVFGILSVIDDGIPPPPEAKHMKMLIDVRDFIWNLARADVRSVHVSRTWEEDRLQIVVWVESNGLGRERAQRAFEELPAEIRAMARLILQDEELQDWHRASGEAVCDRCGLVSYSHPPSRSDGDLFHRLCDGRKVKT
jgi:hypothetical protein